MSSADQRTAAEAQHPGMQNFSYDNYEDKPIQKPFTPTDTSDWTSFAARTGFAPVGLSDDAQSPEALSSSALPSSKTNSASSERKQSKFAEAPSPGPPVNVQKMGDMSGGLESGNSHEQVHHQPAASESEQDDMHASAQPSAAHRARWEFLRSLVRQQDHPEKEHHQAEQPIYSSDSSPPKAHQNQFQSGPLPTRSSSKSMRPLMLPQMVEDRKSMNTNVSDHSIPNFHSQETSEKGPPLPPRTQRTSLDPSSQARNPGQTLVGGVDARVSSPPAKPPRPTTPFQNAIAQISKTSASRDGADATSSSHTHGSHSSTVSQTTASSAPPAAPLYKQPQSLPQSQVGQSQLTSVDATPRTQSMQPSESKTSVSVSKIAHKPLQHSASSDAPPGKALSGSAAGTNRAPSSSQLSHEQAPPKGRNSSQAPASHSPPPIAPQIHSGVPLTHPSQHVPPPGPSHSGHAASSIQIGTVAHKPLVTQLAAQTAHTPQRPVPEQAHPKPSPSPAVQSAEFPSKQTSQSGQKSQREHASSTPAQGKSNAAAAAPARQATQPHNTTVSQSTPFPNHRQSALPPPHPATSAHPMGQAGSSVPHTPLHVPANHASSGPPSNVAKAQTPPHKTPPTAPRAGEANVSPHATAVPRSGLSPHQPAISHPPAVPHASAPSHQPAATHPSATSHQNVAHPSASRRPPAAPHQPATPHTPAAHPSAPPHPATARPAAAPHQTAPNPQFKGGSGSSAATASPHNHSQGTTKPDIAKSLSSVPHQGSTAHVTKAAPISQQKQNKAVQPHPARSSVAQHPSGPVTLASHDASTAQPSHSKQHPGFQPHEAHTGATPHVNTPAIHSQPSHSASIQLNHVSTPSGSAQPIRSNPAKPLHPGTQSQTSSHISPPDHTPPARNPQTPKPTGSTNPDAGSHAPSHLTTTSQPSHPQHPPAKSDVKQSIHAALDHSAPLRHAADTTSNPLTRNNGSLGRSGAVKRRDTPRSASENAGMDADRPAAQQSTLPRSSKQSSQTSEQYSVHTAHNSAPDRSPRTHATREPDFQLLESLPAILGQLAGGHEPDGEVDLEQEADNIVHLFLYGTALVFKSFVSGIAEDDGWVQFDYYDSRDEVSNADVVSQTSQSSGSDLSHLDHLSEGNELD